MTENELLEKAAQICVTKHAGQIDKAGQAYFQHPMRVAVRCQTTAQKIVALLHDVIEDTDATAEYLSAQGFPSELVDAVLSVTKRDGESYEDFVRRAAENQIGRIVKLHDLEDNLDLLRLTEIDSQAALRLTKYLSVYRYLQNYTTSSPIQEPTARKDEDANQEPDRIQTKQELYRKLRAQTNARLHKLLKAKTGVNMMQDKISVKMPDGSIIAEKYTIDSLTKIIQTLGYDTVAALNIKHFGKYPLVTREPIGAKYREATMGWHVLSDCYTKFVAIHVNEIADALDIPMIADIVPKG